MNAEVVKDAREIVRNPDGPLHLVSRGARELSNGRLSAGKTSFEQPEIVALTRPNGKDQNRPKHWPSTQLHTR
jgi:hypothetical protein